MLVQDLFCVIFDVHKKELARLVHGNFCSKDVSTSETFQKRCFHSNCECVIPVNIPQRQGSMLTCKRRPSYIENANLTVRLLLSDRHNLLYDRKIIF